MTAPVIRAFREGDAPALAALFHAAVHVVAARHYSPAQVAAWSPAVADPAHWVARAADGRTTLLAVDATDAPLAYADLEHDGHIDHFYCRPDHAGTGVATALYAAIEEAGRARGMTRLFVEASEPARRFFLRRGFAVERRRGVVVRGVPLHNFAMGKPLSAA